MNINIVLAIIITLGQVLTMWSADMPLDEARFENTLPIICASSMVWLCFIYALFDKYFPNSDNKPRYKSLLSYALVAFGVCNIVYLRVQYTANPWQYNKFYTMLACVAAAFIVTIMLVRFVLKRRVNIQNKVSLKPIMVLVLLIIAEQVYGYTFEIYKGEYFGRRVVDMTNALVRWRMPVIKPHRIVLQFDKQNFEFQKYVRPQQEAFLNSIKNAAPGTKLPNIILLMADSLRATQDDSKIMPFTHSQAGLHASNHTANANCTHFGLFSVLTGVHPIHYKEYMDNKYPFDIFRIAKNLGYEINVISDMEMIRWGFDKMLHPVNRLSIIVKDEGQYKNTEQSIQNVLEILNSKDAAGKPQLFLVITNSSHTSYSVDPKYEAPFTPMASGEDWNIGPTNRRGTNDKDLMQRMKNSYNSVSAYIDHLFSNFVSELKKANLYDNAIVILFGDHGEEFAETCFNCWWHGSSLTHHELNSLMYVKLPQDNKRVEPMYKTQHIDIVPTIVGFLSKHYGVESNMPHDAYKGYDLNAEGNDYNREILSYSCADSVSLSHRVLSGKEPMPR